IIGPWATIGTAANAQTDYAVYASGQVVGAGMTASTETAWTTAANAYFQTASNTLTATRTITALRSAGNNINVTLGQFNLETYGLLQADTNAQFFTVTGGAGVLRQPGTAPASMYLNAGRERMLISANIQDNTGALTLVKTGSSALTLSGLNTYTGGVTVDQGNLNLAATNSVFTTALGTGTVTMSSGGIDATTGVLAGTGTTLFNNITNNTLVINGDFAANSNGTSNLYFGTGAVSLGTTPGISRQITVSNGMFTLGGVVSNGTTVNSLSKAGGGTLVLNGANTYTGDTVILAGTLQMGTNPVGSLGSITSSAIGTGNLVFGYTSITTTSGLASDSIAPRTVLNPVAFNGHATLGDAVKLGKLTFSAPADLGQAVRTITTPGGDVQFDGVLSAAAGGVTKNGIGTLILNNANTFGGETNVVLGTLRAGAAGAIPAGTNVRVASSTANQWAILDLAGQNATIGALTLNSTISINGAAASNPIASGTALVTTGAGTLTLGGDLT
ncbi:MAG: hypothetical protein EBR23_12210, partial [Planctomycetia bacterium]|nr:hypothetical protein [Planctomycetia bacterium]